MLHALNHDRDAPAAWAFPEAARANPSTPSLRSYQADCLASLAEAVAAGRSSLGVMPTGSGKSLVIAALMAELAEAGRRSLMLTHVRELVEQDAAAFQRFAPGNRGGSRRPATTRTTSRAGRRRCASPTVCRIGG